jgi:NADPH-dependent 2,4-dienoyl-CoA reductase/sulfur reductase-like enzyme
VKGGLVIVGGGTAGLAAATRARRTAPTLPITVLEQSPHVSLGICGLPYLIGGQIPSLEDLQIMPLARLRQERNLDVRPLNRAEALDLRGRTVKVRDLVRGHLYTLEYERLILAPGGRPRRPAVPGVAGENVFSVYCPEGALALLDWMSRESPRQALVLGAGYLGLEMAEALRRRGLAVHLVERRPELLGGLEPPLQERLVAELERGGVQLWPGRNLEALEGGVAGRVRRALLDGGESLEVDLVVLAAGLTPEPPLLEGLPLRRGAQGGLLVDSRAETSQPGVFAAGDCVEVEHRLTGRRVHLPLAGPAARLGRVAGENAAGGAARYRGALGTVGLRIFGLEVARTGLSRNQARELGIPVQVETVSSPSRARYYPGGGPLQVALVARHPDGRLLGAQAIGPEGAVARVNTVALACQAGLGWRDLEDLEAAYAPPFASLWDPLALAGRLAQR